MDLLQENSMTSSTIAALFTLPSHEAAGINEIEFLLIFFECYKIVILLFLDKVFM